MNLHKSIVASVALTAFAIAIPAMANEDKTVTVKKTTTTSHHHYVYYGEHKNYFAP